jgi:hypothetical protein
MDRVALEHLLGAKTQLPRSKVRSILGWVDVVTLVIVLSGATLWGFVALGVVNAQPSWQMRAIYGGIGLSAVWQWARQRFW